MTLKELQVEAHANAKARGFWEHDRNKGELIALIHSELSEALEELRKPLQNVTEVYYNLQGKPLGVPIEMADVVIRVADFCEAFGIDLEAAILEKTAFNRTRAHMHGKAF